MLELERLVPAVLAGKYRPKDATEELYLGLVCKYTKQYAAATRFFAAALTAKPELAGAWGRYDIACFAILAATGRGKDPATDEQEQARLRQTALTWLRLELNSIKQQVQANPKLANETRDKMRHWQTDTDLRGVREEDRLAKLPSTERVEWEKFWAEVAKLAGK